MEKKTGLELRMDAHFSESATTSLICTVEVHVSGAELVMKFMTNKYHPHISGALAQSTTVITSGKEFYLKYQHICLVFCHQTAALMIQLCVCVGGGCESI